MGEQRAVLDAACHDADGVVATVEPWHHPHAAEPGADHHVGLAGGHSAELVPVDRPESVRHGLPERPVPVGTLRTLQPDLGVVAPRVGGRRPEHGIDPAQPLGEHAGP